MTTRMGSSSNMERQASPNDKPIVPVCSITVRKVFSVQAEILQSPSYVHPDIVKIIQLLTF